MSDVSVFDHGTLIGITALTKAGDDWMNDNLSEDVAHIGPTRFCEPYNADCIVEGMKSDGLEVIE